MIPSALVCPYLESPDPGEIRRLREQHRLSVGDLARMTGVTEVSVYQWEKGKTKMKCGLWELARWKCRVLHARKMKLVKRGA